MAITEHNKRDSGTLDEIARGHKVACELLEFCEGFLHVWPAKERKFLSEWGRVGQAQGRWGDDFGNVVYATAWHHLLQEADTARWPTCRKISARIPSGDVIEILFGVMYLSDRNFENFPQFVKHATIDRRLECYKDVYHSTFDIIEHNKENFKLVTQYRTALETYVYGWRSLLFHAQSEWGTIFAQYRHKGTWDANEILIAFEVMRMGHPVALLRMFKHHPLPPPLATVGARAWINSSHRHNVQP